jgi:hypothetical protein
MLLALPDETLIQTRPKAGAQLKLALSNLLTRLVDNRGESFDHVVCFLGKVAGFGPRPLSIA